MFLLWVPKYPRELCITYCRHFSSALLTIDSSCYMRFLFMNCITLSEMFCIFAAWNLKQMDYETNKVNFGTTGCWGYCRHRQMVLRKSVLETCSHHQSGVALARVLVQTRHANELLHFNPRGGDVMDEFKLTYHREHRWHYPPFIGR